MNCQENFENIINKKSYIVGRKENLWIYNITLVTAEASNVLIFDPEKGIEKAKELKSMIEILTEIS